MSEGEPEDEPEDKLKNIFEWRLAVLKRACSVLPQLRGANELASHDQLIRFGCSTDKSRINLR